MPNVTSKPINITRKSIIKLLGSEREECFFKPDFLTIIFHILSKDIITYYSNQLS